LPGGALHQCNRPRNLVRFAAQARPKPLFFSLFPSAKENHVAPQWPPRRARRPAVNMRRAHRQHEGAIRARIPRQSSLPVPRRRVRRNVCSDACLCLAHVQHVQNNAGKNANLSGKVQQKETGRIVPDGGRPGFSRSGHRRLDTRPDGCAESPCGCDSGLPSRKLPRWLRQPSAISVECFTQESTECCVGLRVL
jgi:hypothetical protein